MKKFVFFGTGDRGRKLYKLFLHYGIEIEYWIDSNHEKWNKELENKFIYPPSRIQNENNIQVCISAIDLTREMYQKVLEYGVPACNIYTFYDAVIYCISHYFTKDKSDKAVGKKNIILDCFNGLGLGGVESWSMTLLKELRKEKYEAYLLSPYGAYEVEHAIKERTLWFDWDADKPFDPGNLESILKVIECKLPCVFISSFVNDALLAACSIKRKYPEKIKVMSVIHQGLPSVYRECSELNPYIDQYIAVSRDIQTGMEEYGVQREKVLHMTCPVKYIEPYKRTYSITNESPLRIGYAGRIESAQKRLDCLMIMIEKLEHLHTNYQLEIAGNGSYLETLTGEIKEHSLDKKINLIGEIKKTEIADFWSKQDICINLSDFEGRSISIMEAMINGAVPVVTDTSGIREDIEDGINGYIVPIGDYTAMAMKIDYLANHRELLKIYGEKSHEILKQKGSIDSHMEFWRNVLQETLYDVICNVTE